MYLVSNYLRDDESCQDLKGRHYTVLTALASYCNTAGYCYPSTASLARAARMDPKNLQKTIKSLVKAKEVVVVHNQGVKTPSGWTNLYFVTRWTSAAGVHIPEAIARHKGRGDLQRLRESITHTCPADLIANKEFLKEQTLKYSHRRDAKPLEPLVEGGVKSPPKALPAAVYVPDLVTADARGGKITPPSSARGGNFTPHKEVTTQISSYKQLVGNASNGKPTNQPALFGKATITAANTGVSKPKASIGQSGSSGSGGDPPGGRSGPRTTVWDGNLVTVEEIEQNGSKVMVIKHPPAPRPADVIDSPTYQKYYDPGKINADGYVPRGKGATVVEVYLEFVQYNRNNITPPACEAAIERIGDDLAGWRYALESWCSKQYKSFSLYATSDFYLRGTWRRHYGDSRNRGNGYAAETSGRGTAPHQHGAQPGHSPGATGTGGGEQAGPATYKGGFESLAHEVQVLWFREHKGFREQYERAGLTYDDFYNDCADTVAIRGVTGLI